MICFPKLVRVSALLAVGSLFVGCSSSSPSTTGTGGSGGGAAGSGGSTGTGGSGGATGSGGSGGSTGTGGTTGSGGSGGATGTGGSGGGTDAAAGSDGGAGTDMGGGDRPSEAPAGVMAVATLAPLAGAGTMITGTVTFTAKGADVEVVYALDGCPEGIHGTHIHAGTGCGSEAMQGMHWDGARGEGIGGGGGRITCDAAGKGVLTYTRTGGNAATNWSIGGPASSNVIGHPVIIHGIGETNAMRHSCGIIMMK